MSRSARRRCTQAGFTLVEVLIALAILAGGLVILLRSTASNVYAGQRTQLLTAATNLARGKMYDLEEVLLAEGFQETDQSEEGDFSDEGWPNIKWKAEIVKIELPDMASLAGLAEGAEGEDGTSGTTGGIGGGMFGGAMGGSSAGESGDDSSGMGGGIMGTYYTMVSEVLTAAIRKITLTVHYEVFGEPEDVIVSYYVTEPKAVNEKIPFAGGSSGPTGGATDDSGGDTDSRGTRGSGSTGGSTRGGSSGGRGAVGGLGGSSRQGGRR